MIGARNSESRKRSTLSPDPVEIVARALYADDPMWSYSMRRYYLWSESPGSTIRLARSRAERIVAALRENGLLS